MRPEPAAHRSSVLDDLRAGLRHSLIRVRMTARDPLALLLLALAGLATIPAWDIGLSVNALVASASIRGAAPRLWFLSMFVLVHLLCGLMVAVTVAGRVSGRSAGRATVARAMPALPIGPRARVAAEAVAGLAFVLLARIAVLALGWTAVPHWLFGDHRSGLGVLVFLVQTTGLGVLFALPMVLAWTTMARLDWRAQVKPALATVLLLAGALVGAMGHPGSALVLSLSLSALLLVRLDDGERADPRAAERPAPLRFRPSPGPLRQLRRDAWVGPARTLWPLATLALGVPLVLETLYPRRFLFLPLLQILALTVLPFFPFGMKLTGSGGPLFSGRSLRSWSTLPVPRERVIRGFYVHGLVAAGLVWLVLCADVARHGGARALRGLPLFELPAVFLVTGIVTCEAVGDRGRGLLAIGCLAGFQFVVPVTLALANTVVDLSTLAVRPSESFLLAEAFGLGLLGGLPPLVHLRGHAPRPA